MLRPSGEPKKQLDDLVSQQQLVNDIVLAVEGGEIRAFNEDFGFHARNLRGSLGYGFGHRDLANALAKPPHKFLPDIDGNQMRMKSPLGYSGLPFRILFCRGKQDGSLTRVNRKGRLTKYLINHENAIFGPQRPLPHLGTVSDNEDRCRNFWIVSEVTKDNKLIIYAVFPVALLDGRQTFSNLDYRILHRGDLGESQPRSLDVPPSVDTPVLLLERTGTDG